MFGVPVEYEGPDRWEVQISWRYQRSDEHFVGHEEQIDRETEQSQVINTINLADVTVTRKYASGWQVAVALPYLMAERSSPVRDDNREVVDRSITQARGFGDLGVLVRKWFWNPALPRKGNIALGVGLKIPTGDDNVVDTRKTLVAGDYVLREQTVDQSIQPGDGGFGVIVDLQMFRLIAKDRMSVYGSAVYLINPEGENGVETYRSRPGEEIMSVPDQYLVRAGIAGYPGKGFSVSLGVRAEGVPVYDLIGSSDGFRRPGYAISFEPGMTWSHKAHTISFALPIAFDRARLASVPDRENGVHGDAAFARYLVLLGYVRRF